MISAGCLPHEVPHRFVRTSPSANGTLKPTSGDGETAMATVYVVTAGSGDSYRIERVYLDSDAGVQVRPGLQRHRPGGTGPGRGMAGRRPARRLRRPLLARGVVGASPGQQAARGAAAHRRGRTVRRLRHPPGMVDRRRPARGQGGAPGTGRGAQDRGGRACPRRRWRRLSGTRSPRRGPTWPESPGNSFRFLCDRWNKTGMATRHCRPRAS